MKIINGQFLDAEGNPLAGATLTLLLSQNATSGTAQVGAVIITIVLDSQGRIPANTEIFANDELLPLNTYYIVTVSTDDGIVWGPQMLTITGASPVDLGQIIPLGAGLPAVVPASTLPYDLTLYAPGIFTSNLLCAEMNVVRSFVLPGGLAGSIARLDVAPTGQAVFSIQRNGIQIGTVTFAASAQSGTFAMSGPASFNPGDILTIVAPGSPDFTAAGLSLSLLGSRS